MRKWLWLMIILCCFSLQGIQTKIDSLQTSLEQIDDINEKISILNELSRLHWTISFTQSLEYARQTLEIATTESQKAAAHHSIGNAYSYVRDYPNALEHFQKSLEIDRGLQNEKGMAKSFINIGVIYLNLSDYHTSLDFFLKAIKFVENNGNSVAHGAVLKNIGSVYWYLKNYEKALEYFLQAKEIEEENNDLEGVAGSLNNIGTIYWNSKEYDKALDYLEQALATARKIKDKIIIAGTLNNIGELYYTQKKYTKAMNYYQESLTIKKEINDQNGIAYTLLNMGNLYRDKNELDKAHEKYLTGLKIAQEIKSKNLCEKYYSNLSKLYSAKQNYKEALRLFQQYTEIRDSIYSDEVTRRIAELDIKYETEKKEKELELLRKDHQIKTMHLKRQRINWIFSLFAIILLVIIALILLNRYHLKLKSNKLLQAEIKERKTIEEHLKKLKENLEITVQERTQEIIASNKKLEHEISEKEKVQETIRKSLIEKEILLKEVHHRVKNNMQVILSLLKLQAANIKDETLLQIFRSSQNRIMAMALVHEKLYVSKNFAEINMHDYFYSLSRYLIIQYSAHETRCEIETNQILLNANIAIPVGLIFNEVVSNSLKHAFEKQQKGVIKILLQKEDDKHFFFQISDDGIGFSDDQISSETSNIGLQLINSLIAQLEATLEIQKQGGTVYNIRFSVID